MILDPVIPRLSGLDHTASLAREGYQFVGQRCDARGVDGVVARLRGRETLCIRGLDAAELIYGDSGVTRAGAMPAPIRHLLQDDGSVQGLDGQAHQRRRDLFLAVLAPPSAERLVALARQWWAGAVDDWPVGATKALHPLMNRVLTGAALEWAGLPCDPETVSRLAVQLSGMIDHAGPSNGMSVASVAGNVWARARRRSTERWVGDHIRALRVRGEQPRDDRIDAAAQVAWHREDGDLLQTDVAAVELINLLRPVVAVSRFVVFTAMALARHPEWISRLGDDDPTRDGTSGAPIAVAHEVRRTHPFFPAILTIATDDARWGPVPVPPGTPVLFDLYGTNHHPELWPYPWAFRPERFDEPTAVERLVPQGWGDPVRSHRCPGEPVTVRLVAAFAGELARFPHLLPMQDLTLPLNHLPTLPARGLQVTRTD